jgi:hypothetical protein
VERHPRRTEPVEISDRLATLLGRLRAAAGSDATAELDVDRVRDVEAGVACRLPDPILAIIAARIEPLEDTLSLGLGAIMAHTKRGRDARARGDFIVFGAHPDGHVLHGFVIGASDDQIAVFDAGDRSLSSMHVVAWLEQQAEACGLEPVDALPLVPRLVRAAKPEPEGPRVRHAKWGVGRVLTDVGKGPQRKVKAAFAEVGIKTINARFVEFLDEET